MQKARGTTRTEEGEGRARGNARLDEGDGRNVEKIYQDKNTIVEITVHTKPKRVSRLFVLGTTVPYRTGLSNRHTLTMNR